MTRNDLLTRINMLDQLPDCKDSVWLHWRGKVFSADEHFPRLDKLFLYMIWRESSDRPMTLRRIIGVKCQQGRCLEPVVVFTTENLYRLQEEGLRGRIVRERDVRSGTQAVPAGLCKTLEIGNRSWQLNPHKSGDRLLFDALLPLGFDVPEYESDPVPDLFLTCPYKSTNLKLRQNPQLRTIIQNHVKYDSKRSLLENFVIHRADIGQDAGGNRLAYPYDAVFGQGIVAGTLKPSLQSREADISLFSDNGLYSDAAREFPASRRLQHDGSGIVLWSKWVCCSRADLDSVPSRHQSIRFEFME